MLSVAGEKLAGLELPLRNDAASMRSKRSARTVQKDPKEDKGRIPHPSHRHASPSAPWPWVDLEDGEHPIVVNSTIFSLILLPEVDPQQLECGLPPIPELCDHKSCASDGKEGCWKGYPQSRFPNWTKRQVLKSKIYGGIKEYPKDRACTLYRVDVDKDGFFTNPGPLVAEPRKDREAWDQLICEEVSVINA
jgi:hypothetical protein